MLGVCVGGGDGGKSSSFDVRAKCHNEEREGKHV